MSTTKHDDCGELAARFRPVLMRLDLVVRRQDSQYALSRAQTSILSTLGHHGELRMSDLARLENIRVPTTSNTVSIIESMGLVERRPDPADGRGVCVRLTDQGRRRVEQVLARRDDDLAASLSRLSDDHREALAAAIPGLLALLDAFAGTEHPPSTT